MPKMKKSKKAATKAVQPAAVPAKLDQVSTASVPFGEQLAAMQKSIHTADTRTIAAVFASLKPMEKAITGVLKTAGDVLKSRVQERMMKAASGKAVLKSDAEFQVDGKNHSVDIDGMQSVSVQLRESVVERDGAVEWLQKRHPELYMTLTEPCVTIDDAGAVYEVLLQLQYAVKKGSLKRGCAFDSISSTARLLGSVVHTTRRLDAKAVEKAVKADQLTATEIQEHLYEIRSSYAIMLVKQRTDDGDDE